MYTIHYLDDNGEVQKTQGGFSTLERIHQNHAIIKVRKSNGSSLLSRVGGDLYEAISSKRKGGTHSGKPN